MIRKIISAAAIVLFVAAAAGAQDPNPSWAVSRAFPGGNTNWGLPGWSQGCCENVPSCCDSIWDNYCEQRKCGCHRQRHCGRGGCYGYAPWYGGGSCGCNGDYQIIEDIPQGAPPGIPTPVAPAPAPPAPGPAT